MSPLSTLTAMTRRPFAAFSVRSVSSAAISSWHDVHQVAQTFRTVGDCAPPRWMVSPARVRAAYVGTAAPISSGLKAAESELALAQPANSARAQVPRFARDDSVARDDISESLRGGRS